MILAITGPTGVGKTALSLEVAERLGAEIVSCDSRQVFRELTVGTAKPNPDELARVRHHFVGERSLADGWSAGAFAADAEARIRTIHARGGRALIVGGSTMYLDALVHGLSTLPPAVPELRERLNAVAETAEGRAALFDELRAADPAAAATLDVTKSQRLVRFVEVLRSSGLGPSTYWAQQAPPAFEYRVVVLDRPRDELYARIESRVDAMLDNGLVEENRALLERYPLDLDIPTLRTIGYREPRRMLAGELSREEMVTLLKRNTRRYAKRQLTWHRRRPGYVWMDARSSTAGALLRLLDRPDPGVRSPRESG